MSHLSKRRSLSIAGIGLGALSVLGVMMSSPAAAEPPVPPDVWIQCSGFSGPNTTWPHPLTGCIARGEEGSGFNTAHSARHRDDLLERTVPGRGELFQLTNITSQVVGTGTGCPADHPVEVNVSGTISATEPGTKQILRLAGEGHHLQQRYRLRAEAGNPLHHLQEIAGGSERGMTAATSVAAVVSPAIGRGCHGAHRHRRNVLGSEA